MKKAPENRTPVTKPKSSKTKKRKRVSKALWVERLRQKKSLEIGILLVGYLLLMVVYFYMIRPEQSEIELEQKDEVVSDTPDKIQQGEPTIAEDSEGPNPTRRIKRTLTCYNPHSTSYEKFTFTMLLSEGQDVEELTWACGLSVIDGGTRLNVHTIYIAVGYAITNREELPAVVEVSTPELELVFREGYSRDKVVRLSEPSEPLVFRYTTDYLTGAQNCRQWESSAEILACGVPGITLKDSAIEVLCVAEETGKSILCDELVETLSVNKL